MDKNEPMGNQGRNFIYKTPYPPPPQALSQWSTILVSSRDFIASLFCKLFTWIKFFLSLYPRLVYPVDIILMAMDFCWQGWAFKNTFESHTLTGPPRERLLFDGETCSWTEKLRCQLLALRPNRHCQGQKVSMRKGGQDLSRSQNCPRKTRHCHPGVDQQKEPNSEAYLSAYLIFRLSCQYFWLAEQIKMKTPLLGGLGDVAFNFPVSAIWEGTLEGDENECRYGGKDRMERQLIKKSKWIFKFTFAR